MKHSNYSGGCSVSEQQFLRQSPLKTLPPKCRPALVVYWDPLTSIKSRRKSIGFAVFWMSSNPQAPQLEWERTQSSAGVHLQALAAMLCCLKVSQHKCVWGGGNGKSISGEKLVAVFMAFCGFWRTIDGTKCKGEGVIWSKQAPKAMQSLKDKSSRT